MSHDEQELPDARDAALDDRYRRASAADAGRPSDATRAAILARAAEQVRLARRTVPAANDARVAWRAVAGVAVLGVAVLLWRQAEWRPPGQPQPASIAQVAPEAGEPDATPPVAAASAPASVAPAPPAVSLARAPAAVADLGSAESSVSTDPADSPESRQSVARVSSALARSAPAEALRERAEDRLQAGAAAPSRAVILLREQFPALALRESPVTVWLVLDSAGAVVRKGELAAGLTLAEQARRLAADPDALQVDEWRTQVVTNESGQPVTVATAELPR